MNDRNRPGDSTMTWLQRYRVRHYVTNSIWIHPVCGMVVALVITKLLLRIDDSLGWRSDLSVAAVESMLGTLAASMFTFIVFISSALLVAIQLASAQLTPRIIGFAFRDPVIKAALTCFIITFTIALAVLIRIDNTIPLFSVRVAAYSCLASLGVFLYLMNHMGNSFRPNGALRAIISQGRKVIETTYPRLLTEPPDILPKVTKDLDGTTANTIPSIKSGVILTLDIQNLVALAQQADCIIELIPRVGDYVAAGDPLFRVYGGGACLSTGIFQHSIALGLERTIEHDPAFVFRIIVDIAVKALSPAINDPTTAVLALDQIHRLLHNVGKRHLDSGYLRDETGQVRLIFPTPDWEDYVHLAVTEIRHWGASSIQVVCRLRAMLENLIQNLTEERARLLRQELSLLRKTAGRMFPEPEDRKLANGIETTQDVDEYRSGNQWTRHESS